MHFNQFYKNPNDFSNQFHPNIRIITFVDNEVFTGGGGVCSMCSVINKMFTFLFSILQCGSENPRPCSSLLHGTIKSIDLILMISPMSSM